MKSQPTIRNTKHKRGSSGRVHLHLRGDDFTFSKAGTKNHKLPGLILIAAVIFFTVFLGTGWSIQNYTVRSPIISATTPPSNFRSGLFRSPNPIDTSFNNVITGNVRGGKHFRGGIPYRSPSSFWTGLGAPSENFTGGGIGSSSLDSFLRDSAGSEDFGRYTRGRTFRPFYSPSNSVSTTMPGRPGIFKPTTQTKRFDSRISGKTGSALSLKHPTMPIRDVSTFDTGLQQTPVSIPGVKQTPPGQLSTYQKGTKLTADRYLEQMEQLRDKLEQIRGRAAELGQKPAEKYDALQAPGTTKLGERIQQPFETQQRPKGLPVTIPKPEVKPEVTTSQNKRDIYEKITQQLENQSSSEPAQETKKEQPLIQLQPRKDLYGIPLKGAAQLPVKQRLTETTNAVDIWDSLIRKNLTKQQYAPTKTFKSQEIPGSTERQDIYRKRSTKYDLFGTPLAEQRVEPFTTTKKRTWGIEEVDKLSTEELSTKVKHIMGPHTNYTSFVEEKFNQHIRIAELHMKKGKYYRAANAYTLASIYKSNDPLLLAGKAHALFAAGEYMSSVLFISRAIEAKPEYAQSNVDLVSVLGNTDKIESRIVDIKNLLNKNSTAELHFLLGYVYYRIGKLDEAKEAIDAAYGKKPESPIIGIFKKAIYDALMSSMTK